MVRRLIIFAVVSAGLMACTPARVAGNAAITTGKVALGAADMVL